MEQPFDVVIIGAGPGGYVAAIRAAQLGLSVCLVEKDVPGGVCLNWGCIPSKSLIHHASEFRALFEVEALGVKIDRRGFKYSEVQGRSRKAAKTLADGVSSLLRKNKIEVIKGKGLLTKPGKPGLHRVDVGQRSIAAKNVIIATGSRPLATKAFAIDEQNILSSNGMLAMAELPKSLIILGAGAIGCEFAYVMNAFGVQVTLIEMGPHILPAEDRDAVQVVDSSFRQAGIAIFAKTQAMSWRQDGAGLSVAIKSGADSKELKAEKVLAAFGRTPNTQDIGLDAAGVKCDARGYVLTGDHCQTNRPGIFAIGDVTTTPSLAHVASREGEMAVEFIAGHASSDKRIDAELVPSAIYCEPQLAGFGLREDAAIENKIACKKSVFPYRGTGKSVAIGKTEGLVKILTDPTTGELLGAHIVGHNATELIHELLLAKTAELLPEDIVRMIHAHPSLSEAMMESARGINGSPIHI